MQTLTELDEYFKKLKKLRESTDELEKDRLKGELDKALEEWESQK